jgi:hypothetical protein
VSLVITADRQPLGEEWGDWVDANGLGDCVHLTARNESLTEWTGVFLQRDDAGRIVFDEDRSTRVTVYRYVTTTPAKPTWVREI